MYKFQVAERITSRYEALLDSNAVNTHHFCAVQTKSVRDDLPVEAITVTFLATSMSQVVEGRRTKPMLRAESCQGLETYQKVKLCNTLRTSITAINYMYTAVRTSTSAASAKGETLVTKALY